MTQSAQSERAQTALKTSGITDVPLMSLEREDALFVLTGDLLIYQDGGGTRRVTLRDLTRIHSDQAGLLRVETPAGTALTASLLGFDVAQVQTFFKGVRSATARAKDLPDSPTPTPGGAKTFGSAPAAVDGEAKAQDTQAHTSSAAAVPDATVPELAGMPAASGSPDAGPQTGESAKASTPAIASPAMQGAAPEQVKVPEDDKTQVSAAAGSLVSTHPVTVDAATPKLPPAASSESTKTGGTATGGSVENPVVISSSSFSPNVSRPGLGAVVAAKADTARSDTVKSGTAKPETSKTDVSRATAPQAEPSKPDLRKGQTTAPVSDTSADQTASRIELPNRPTPRSAVAVPGNTAPDSPKPELQATPDPMTTAAPPVTALSKVAAATALARQAGTVEGLAGRLKLLGAVLFVGALALAFFQFTGDQALAGIWTLLSGGVGAIALLALGELSALLALMARVPGPVRTTAQDGGHDG